MTSLVGYLPINLSGKTAKYQQDHKHRGTTQIRVYVMTNQEFNSLFSPIMAWAISHGWHLFFVFWAVYVAAVLTEIRDSLASLRKM